MSQPPESYAFHAFEISAPPEWNRRRHTTLTLPPEDGFSAEIHVIEDWVPLSVPLVLQRIAERRLDELWRTLPHFDAVSSAEENRVQRLCQVLEYTWRVERRTMRAREIMWLDGRFLTSIAFADRDERFEVDLPTFESWLSRLRWKAPG